MEGFAWAIWGYVVMIDGTLGDFCSWILCCVLRRIRRMICFVEDISSRGLESVSSTA